MERSRSDSAKWQYNETYDKNSRKTWETIDEVTRRKSDKAAINELELNGARINNSTEIAEGFNKFFAEIGPDLSRDIEVVGTFFDEIVNQTSSCFSFQRATQLHILSHLNQLYKKEATGLDSVSVRLLKECPDLFPGSLALIINLSTLVFSLMNGRVQESRLFLRKLEAGVILLIVDRYRFSRLWPRFWNGLFDVICIISYTKAIFSVDTNLVSARFILQLLLRLRRLITVVKGALSRRFCCFRSILY